MVWSSFTTVFDTDVPPDAAAVVSVAPLGAAVVSDESPLLHAAASNEIAAIPASASLTDVVRLRISTFPSSHGSRFVGSVILTVANCRNFDEVMPGWAATHAQPAGRKRMQAFTAGSSRSDPSILPMVWQTASELRGRTNRRLEAADAGSAQHYSCGIRVS